MEARVLPGELVALRVGHQARDAALAALLLGEVADQLRDLHGGGGEEVETLIPNQGWTDVFLARYVALGDV